MRRKQILTLVLLFFAVIYVFGITSYVFSKAYYAVGVPAMSNIAESRVTTGDRILVIAPHPDDETIGAGGLIFREKKLGKTVKVVIMTNGDGFRKAAEKIFRVGRPQPADYIELGKIRQQEAINALANLGLASKDVVFLGYGDGSLAALWDGYWDHTPLYKARNGYSRSPYSNSFEKNAPYCGENVVKNLMEIFAEYRPTDIFYPDPDDMHPDHWATSNFVKFAVEELNYKPRLYTYLVHHYQWPDPLLYAPGAELLPPVALKSVGTDWHVYPLDGEEIETKHRAMLEYKSQYKVMPEFLDAFIRRNELFGTYADGSFAVDSRSGADFAKDGEMPYTVIRSSVEDNPLLMIKGRDDIKNVAFFADNDFYYLGIETRQNISAGTTYVLNARFIYSGDRFRKLKYVIRQYRVEAVNDSGKLIKIEDITADFYKNKLWVKMQKNKFLMPEKVFLNAETYDMGRKIDKTAWRMVTPSKCSRDSE